MERMKRFSFMLLIVTLAFFTFAGCSGSKNEPVQPNATPANSQSGDVKEPSGASHYLEKPVTLRMFTPSQQTWPYKADWAIWNWMKEKTNIAVKGEIPAGNAADSLALTIASGDLPDLLYIYQGDDLKYGQQGALTNLAPHLAKMPNVQKFFADNPATKARITAPGGELYYITNEGAGVTNWRIWFNREDIFKKHNLQQPKTWDDLYQVATELKKLYPDSFPIAFRHGLTTLEVLAPSFGTYPSYYPDPATGKAKYGPIENSFKDLITYLNKFYKEGLIAPDWLSWDYKAWTHAITTNKSFITVQYIAQMEIINNQLKGANMQFMAPPAGTGGKAYLPNGNFETGGLAVSSKTKNLDAALKFIDFQYSKEGIDLLSWGKEGVTYTVESGQRKFKPEYKEFTDLRKNLGIMTTGTYGVFDTKSFLSMIAEKERYVYYEAPKYAFPVQILTPNFTPDELDLFQTVETNIRKHYEENVSKFILGDRPLSEWDKFVEEINKLGVQKIIAIHQTGWDRQKAKK
ncbi:extracellular solute-binding protein [Gordoniibacillus kamchatkensis]|uniref:extracellular solute-binding protein n=1 Tax=Gordoniibacillus kamchatkensis TaxID=1590651 RepID=UPI000698AB9B|nr:extracellular solute-binding protein [Paenibacillus sp. VKM B-2647]